MASPVSWKVGDSSIELKTELGINPSHILAKSLTVLNPISKVDSRIMDDADLAGPFVFCFGFALVLLFVGPMTSLLTSVWQAAILVHLRRSLAGYYSHLPFAQYDVRDSDRCVQDCECPWLLPVAYGRFGWRWHGHWH